MGDKCGIMDRLAYHIYEHVRTTHTPVTARSIRQFVITKRGGLVAHLSPRDLSIRLSRILYEGVRDGYLLTGTSNMTDEVCPSRVPVVYLPARQVDWKKT